MSELGVMYRALRPWLLGYAKLDQRVGRVRSAFALFAEGFVLAGLDAAEPTDLTISIYDRLDRRTQSMFPWELTWFEAALPRPPARVLVGAAGHGREVLALRGLGYDVDAFEPAPRSRSQLYAAVASGTALTGSYEDLVHGHKGEPSPLAALAAKRYDAILLGWASLSHLPDARERRALFEACHALCPRGPILASFFYARESPVSRSGSARAWGTRLGGILAQARGIKPVATVRGPDRLLLHAGIVHEELETLARTIDRKLALEPTPYAHATWSAAVITSSA
jgi:hypothetical protein